MRYLKNLQAILLMLALAFTSSAQPLAAAQEPQGPDLEVQNASTVDRGSATPEASPASSPMAGVQLTGYLIGDPDAPVTLQVYSDYQCSFCRAFFLDVVPQIIDKYVVTGQVRIEWLDMTVVGVDSIDELDDDSLESVQAAEAAMCAAEQDAYREYSSALFAIEMTPNTGAFSNDNLKTLAGDLGLDQAQFDDCLDSGKYEEAVIAFVHQAVDRGVRGTPTLSINGGEVFLVPENGFEGISEMLDEALAS